MRKFIAGLILGVGLMVGVSAHAEVTSIVGQIIEGQFPVKVDDKTIESPGIVVNGTSYLPVREFGEMLGYDVSFNADMGVELQKKATADSAKTEKSSAEISPEVRLKQIDDRLHGYLYPTLKVLDGVSEEGSLDELKAEIQRLEAEKAELEAQLAP